MNEKIKCRDCGEPTSNRTERCKICRQIWSNNMMGEMHADGFKFGSNQEAIGKLCLLDGFKGTALDMAAMSARCGCNVCNSINNLGVKLSSATCTKCSQLSITLIDGICNTCLSKMDSQDEIKWPKHYNTGKIQPIDAIEDWGLDFRLANAVKYIARQEHKGNAKKDLEKAIWYIQRYIDKKLTKDENNG